MTTHYDTIIVGAGLSGLSCAVKCQEANISYCLIDKQPRLGGRVGSVLKDGFVLDLGFQVYNTSYSSANGLLGGSHKHFHRFRPGAAVHINGKPRLFSDPLRDPGAILPTLRFPKASVLDFWRLLMLRLDIRGLARRQPKATSLSTMQYLEGCGFSQSFIDSFFQPFFSGVFLEQDLATSSKFFRLVFSSFNQGYAAIPNGGMQEIPRTMARGLDPGSSLLGVSVESILPGNRLKLADGRIFTYGHLVLTGESIQLACQPRTRYLPVCTVYYAAAHAGPYPKYIHLFPGDELITNAAFLSSVAPGYAPSGENLVSVSVLGDAMDTPDLELAVTERLSRYFSGTNMNFRHLHTFRSKMGTLFQKPGVSSHPKPNMPNMVFAGELFTHASIEGAVLSGYQAFDSLQGMRDA